MSGSFTRSTSKSRAKIRAEFPLPPWRRQWCRFGSSKGYFKVTHNIDEPRSCTWSSVKDREWRYSFWPVWTSETRPKWQLQLRTPPCAVTPCRQTSLRCRRLERRLRPHHHSLPNNPSYKHSCFLRWHSNHEFIRLAARRWANLETGGRKGLRRDKRMYISERWGFLLKVFRGKALDRAYSVVCLVLHVWYIQCFICGISSAPYVVYPVLRMWYIQCSICGLSNAPYVVYSVLHMSHVAYPMLHMWPI